MPKHRLLPQFAKALGFRIQELRRKRGWTQEKFALLCNLHRSHIGQIERGETNLTLSTIVTIANTLGITVKELFMVVPLPGYVEL